MNRGMAMVLTLFVLASALFAGWYSGRGADYFPDRLRAVRGVCPVSLPMPDWPVQDEVLDEWLSVTLADFREPSLYRPSASIQRSVRFTLIHEVHGPVVVRVDVLPDGRLQMTAKHQPSGLSNVEGEPTRYREVVRILTPTEIARLEDVFARTRLLQLPDNGCYPGVHGFYWVVEVNDVEAGYHYRQALSPEDGPEFEVGIAMLDLTGWPVEPILRRRPL